MKPATKCVIGPSFDIGFGRRMMRFLHHSATQKGERTTGPLKRLRADSTTALPTCADNMQVGNRPVPGGAIWVSMRTAGTVRTFMWSIRTLIGTIRTMMGTIRTFWNPGREALGTSMGMPSIREVTVTARSPLVTSSTANSSHTGGPVCNSSRNCPHLLLLAHMTKTRPHGSLRRMSHSDRVGQTLLEDGEKSLKHVVVIEEKLKRGLGNDPGSVQWSAGCRGGRSGGPVSSTQTSSDFPGAHSPAPASSLSGQCRSGDSWDHHRGGAPSHFCRIKSNTNRPHFDEMAELFLFVLRAVYER
uniref:Uncharacterized protein n=1 Tax=Timema genevievae TaxID=629358 RepID=A0A7R9JYD9_TIMGE|nr:unnamed protein product [Timema genevievae]